MKVLIGWLSDPWVHLLGIGVLVVGIGSRMGEAKSPPVGLSGLPECENCRKDHDASRPCYEFVNARLASRTTH